MTATLIAPDSTVPDVTVIGAGIVGLCTSLSLQRAGLRVRLCDGTGAGTGASFGNAGLISVGSVVPIALPGMVSQVPAWLLDAHGPLAVRPGYALQAAPWLIQWLRAASPARVRRASDALNALHAPAVQRYEDLLGSAACHALIRRQGQLHVWSQAGNSQADALVAELRRKHQVPMRPMDDAELHGHMPQLADHVRAGVCFTAHAHAHDPFSLTQALLAAFEQAGGDYRVRAVQRIEAVASGGYRLWTGVGDERCERVVVAAGAHSAELLKPLGIQLPLEFERGYHAQLPHPGVVVPMPFIYKDKAVAVTPMQHGLRFAGTVEIAGLRHPPNPQRIDAILQAAQTLFPGINTQGARTWFGLRPSTPDSVPIVDESKRHRGLYMACGHGHTGMTGAPMTGALVTELISGQISGLRAEDYALARFG